MAGSMVDQYLVGVGEAARRGLEQAREVYQGESGPSNFRRGRVVGVDGNGVYTVQILAADGSGVDTIPGVRTWGVGAVDLGAEVWLTWEGGRPVPWIVGGGGSGSGEGVYIVTGGLGFAS